MHRTRRRSTIASAEPELRREKAFGKECLLPPAPLVSNVFNPCHGMKTVNRIILSGSSDVFYDKPGVVIQIRYVLAVFQYCRVHRVDVFAAMSRSRKLARHENAGNVRPCQVSFLPRRGTRPRSPVYVSIVCDVLRRR